MCEKSFPSSLIACVEGDDDRHGPEYLSRGRVE